MRIDVFSIFPDVVDAFCSASLLGKARAAGLLDLRTHDLRDHTTDVHRTVDDSPFGGGAGMLMRPEPIFAAVEAADPPRPLFLLGPGGRRFDQALAHELAAGAGFSLLCGRYEGVDHRIREHLVDDELSVGDVVLAGGEVAACLVDRGRHPARAGRDGQRRQPGHRELRRARPARGAAVHPPGDVPRLGRCPTSLRSGDHGRIERWRHAQALHRTLARRPDLIAARGGLTARGAAAVGRVPAAPVSLTGPSGTLRREAGQPP